MDDLKGSFFKSWLNCTDLCCSNIGATEFAAMMNLVVLKTIVKDSYFVRKGQRSSYIAFVASGMMRHFYQENGKEITKWIALPGTFSTALLSFVTRRPSLENIQAIEDTELYCLSQGSWLKLCHDFPAFKDQWRLKIESHYFSIQERMHHFIYRTPEQRYDALYQKYPNLIEHAPHKYIASMLGIKPRMLSHIRQTKNEMDLSYK